jgi:oligosaccharide repeat unit polymerase
VSNPSSAALICSIALIGWAAAMRAVAGTWLQPSAFFALWWCCAGILPLILAPQERVGVNAIAWLVVASVTFSIGALIGNWGFKTKRIATPPPSTDRELTVFGIVCLVATVLGTGSSVAFVAGTSGFSFADVFDIQKLVVVSNQAYFSRYIETGAAAAPPFSQPLLPFVYLAPAVGGVLFVLSRDRRLKLLAIVSFFPAVAVTILQTTKAAMLFAMVLWLSSYFAMRLRQGKLAVFTKAHLLVAVSLGAVLTAFFFAVGFARIASTDVTLISTVYGGLTSSAFGHMTVLSGWLTDYMNAPFSPTLGIVTFSGPLEMLGFGERLPGLFENIVDLVAGQTSNVYTGFRPLIQDFTMPGALAVLALLGVIGGVGFRKVAVGQSSALPLLIIAYVTIFWTPITWFWIYNSATATVVAVGMMVWFVRLWRGTRHVATS